MLHLRCSGGSRLIVVWVHDCGVLFGAAGCIAFEWWFYFGLRMLRFRVDNFGFGFGWFCVLVFAVRCLVGYCVVNLVLCILGFLVLDFGFDV